MPLDQITIAPVTSFKSTLRSFVINHDRSRKIDCIKHVRTMTHCSLIDAKNYVEAIFADAFIDQPIPRDIDLPPVIVSASQKPMKNYAEAKAPIFAAIRAMIEDTAVSDWDKRDILSDIQNAVDTIRSYRNVFD